MSNIREDKGFTYGIYSALISMPNAGIVTIATEVNQNVWEQAVREIFYEIDRLKNEPVPGEELLTVKNYMLGQLLSQINGTFNQLSTIQGLYMYGLKTDYYQQLVQTIQTISPTDIMQLAQQYSSHQSYPSGGGGVRLLVFKQNTAVTGYFHTTLLTRYNYHDALNPQADETS